jgi:SAM-dependent methyltransferase
MKMYFVNRAKFKLAKLNEIRVAELHNVINILPSNAQELNLIEIGSGTGIQLKYLKKYFKSVVGLEIEQSNYDNNENKNIIFYDGVNIPIDDSSYDIIFSSHVMEHIVNFKSYNAELKRILKPDGVCIHVVPNSKWKFYNTLFHYPFLVKTVIDYFVRMNSVVGLNRGGTLSDRKRSIFTLCANVLFPPLHGENGNRFTEIFYLTNRYWKTKFKKENWNVDEVISSNYFVAGHFILPNSIRSEISKILGSTSTIYILKK